LKIYNCFLCFFNFNNRLTDLCEYCERGMNLKKRLIKFSDDENLEFLNTDDNLKTMSNEIHTKTKVLLDGINTATDIE
jgi:hypothetical protein